MRAVLAFILVLALIAIIVVPIVLGLRAIVRRAWRLAEGRSRWEPYARSAGSEGVEVGVVKAARCFGRTRELDRQRLTKVRDVSGSDEFYSRLMKAQFEADQLATTFNGLPREN